MSYCDSDPKFDMHISYVSQRVHNKLFWEYQLICSKYFSLANIPFVLLSFCLSVFIDSLNGKYSSRMTPKKI